jgi:hypothetical protein
MKALLALALLATAASSSLAAPWPLALVLIPGLWRAIQGTRVPARHDPQAGCPVCGRQWRDLNRHLAFAHQETVVMELP